MNEQPILEHPNAELIKGLEDCAAWLRGHPLPDRGSCSVNIFFYAATKEEFLRAVKIMGPCEKVSTDDTVQMHVNFSGGVGIRLFSEHKTVCERVVIGKKIIPAEPEKHVPAMVIAAKPERETEITEWVCPKSFLKEASILDASSEPTEETPTPIIDVQEALNRR